MHLCYANVYNMTIESHVLHPKELQPRRYKKYTGNPHLNTSPLTSQSMSWLTSGVETFCFISVRASITNDTAIVFISLYKWRDGLIRDNVNCAGSYHTYIVQVFYSRI